MARRSQREGGPTSDSSLIPLNEVLARVERIWGNACVCTRLSEEQVPR